MNLVPFSYNGNAINDFTWNGTGIGEWSSEFPMGQRANIAATAIFSSVAYSFPKLSTAQYDGHTIVMTMHFKSKTHTISFLREQAKQWLQMGKDFTPHQLIAQDTEDGNRQWYLLVIPVSIAQPNAGELVVTFAMTDPIWRIVTSSTTGNVTVNSSPQTITIATVRGNVPAQPIITITPQTARTGSFLFKRYIKIYNPNPKPFPFPVSTVDITNGGLDTATLITGSKMLANGNDCRVYVDGVDSNRWFGLGTHAINTATTFIFANIPHSKGQVGTLGVALPNNGTTVNVVFNRTAANLAVLKALTQVINRVFIIDSEIFVFPKNAIDLANYQIKNCVRARKTTAFAAHSVNANITWIEHDVWLLYGQSSAGAPDIDDTKKPMMDLTTTTNSSWVWSQFQDSTASRPGEWVAGVISSITNKLTLKILTRPYTADQNTFANPATELGLQMQTTIVNGIQKSETAFLRWGIYHPAGWATANMSGKKFLFAGLQWPAFAGMQVTNDLVNFIQAWNEGIPTLNTWTAFTHNGVTFSAPFLYVFLELQGSIGAKLNNMAAIQGDTVTLTLGTGILTVAMLAEIANYHITATIRNNTSGEEMYVNLTMQTIQTLTIDCSQKTAVLDDGTNVFAAISLSSGRINADWLNIGQDANAAFVGNASIIYTEPGVVNETVNITWADSAE